MALRTDIKERSPLVRTAMWIVVAVVLGYAALYIYACFGVVRQAHQDEARAADVIIVFGAAEYAGKPSPVFRARLDHALGLYQKKLAPTVITTGGAALDPTYTEGGVGRDYLANKGVPDNDLIAETWSDNTLESAERVARIMRANGMKSCVAVSDPYHLFRVKHMMESQGITTYVSPRLQPTLSTAQRVQSVLREAFSYSLWKLHLRGLVSG